MIYEVYTSKSALHWTFKETNYFTQVLFLEQANSITPKRIIVGIGVLYICSFCEIAATALPLWEMIENSSVRLVWGNGPQIWPEVRRRARRAIRRVSGYDRGI
jgi:hypothetical protein